ncbi:N-terminal acetyltransferase B complex catalytic subunit [Nematocida parisii]|uniref:N-acetyltransferase domain-containing protein n=1 Tax=Nematocida parisii (strain ERTm3) TaxID=935791 RepID=I3EK31_NEMP3|nr:uncharacterized protein NEPG_00888 [Nematocida parisii ERTm1]EIJ89578.1 hypothetical protein NEQG_00348 [Nematocida parisii ERTm3]KAI5128967.1 N-terminal acetyltransferase B complex catalytic subunit [Nematocida parisii]EIJ94221.1 hypothetical protein NEPG_00888 [Nematocida parisii ERTm1]KAI5141479.1 N-terminal acetyltransferase B complex catalytic subunit [Nematocida parisii]KAI5144879.1 N-terminal acetyltransferase B complex catalytic subunit [Nematocida parisii]|eukprot:XP_013058717.1 hypothetical protein NEPG_00888 [Nematocida parisii ERTm1]
MLVYKEFTALDLLDLNLPNLDENTCSFSPDFYLRYLSNHSDYCLSVSSSGNAIGYIIGNYGTYKDTKALYSHVTALSISQEFRRHGIGRNLLQMYDLNAKKGKSKFIDLFVRVSNNVAVNFYKKCGYVVHKTIEKYYTEPEEDAYDMRKYTTE